MNDKDIKTELELLKQDVNLIKTNHLAHMAKDIDNMMLEVRSVNEKVSKIESDLSKFRHIAYGAIVVFVLMSDKFNDILRLL
jgi:archaellum component FlaC